MGNVFFTFKTFLATFYNLFCNFLATLKIIHFLQVFKTNLSGLVQDS